MASAKQVASEPDRQRWSRPPDDATEDVSPVEIGAQHVVWRPGRAKCELEMCLGWIARSNHRREQRHQTDDHHDEDASEPDLVLPQPPPYSLPRPARACPGCGSAVAQNG